MAEQERRIANFEKINKEMLAVSEDALSGDSLWDTRFFKKHFHHNYSLEEVERIIKNGSLLQQQNLSRDFFESDNFYKKLVIDYANLYLYNGILIPNPNNANLSQKSIQKRYNNACNFLDKINLKKNLQHFACEALINGTYYGIIQTLDKDTFAVLDLPATYCRCRFKNKKDLYLIEFDVRYFNTITDEATRKTTLKVYPQKIRNWYNKYMNGEVKSPWAFVPSDIGICFPFYDKIPFFLTTIPATLNYDAAVKTERERDLEEIRKIVTQKIDHLPDGSLLFEPDEVEEMHRGAVEMLKHNPNVSVMTGYADIDAIVSKTAGETASNNLEKMKENIYATAGVSSQIFSANSNLAIETSIANDMACMAPMIEQFNVFITSLVNRLYGNSSISFKYQILPVTQYNQSKYVDTAFKLAGSGYSLLVPAIAMGMSQSDLGNLKSLENDVLKLDEKLKPLGSMYNGGNMPQEGAGAPTKDSSETSDKTEKNKISLEKQGGTTD